MATQTQLAWLKTMTAPAQLSMRRWKVPASVTLAQAILESAWGTSQLARRANNYFGIKALEGEDYCEFATREVVSGRSVREMADFARYPSAIESFDAHARLLAALPRYRRAMDCVADVSRFTEELQHGGYSTDPEYAERLCELIYEHYLLIYDAILTDAAQPAT